MDENAKELVTPFDRMTSSAPLRMMKLLIPYIEPGMQRVLAPLIRMMELKNTMAYFKDFAGKMSAQDVPPTDPADIFKELGPYLPADFQDMMEQMEMIRMMMTEMENINNTENQNGDEQYERMDEKSSLSNLGSGEEGTA